MNQFNNPGNVIPLLPESEEQQTRALGEAIGYGRLMQLAQQEWRKTLTPKGLAGGEFAYGPCVSLTVACLCREAEPDPVFNTRDSCYWCCGAGWVTKKVREAQEQEKQDSLLVQVKNGPSNLLN